MTREAAEKFLLDKGYTRDRWGHLKSLHSEKHRFIVTAYSIRFEARPCGRWIRVASGYLKNVSIKNDKLSGLLRKGCQYV